MKAYALLVGIKDNRACLGSEKDVDNIHGILSPLCWNYQDRMGRLRQAEFEIAQLKTEQATAINVLHYLINAQQKMSKGDLFVFYFSGHGGRRLDLEGDEYDKFDESIVCYDGQIIDDTLHNIWAGFKSGVRILMISDSCHSGTNCGNDIVKKSFFLPIGGGSTNNCIPPRVDKNYDVVAQQVMSESHVIENPRYCRNAFFPSEPRNSRPIKAMLIHMGACRDDQYAQGYSDGGLFTKSFCELWNNDYRENPRVFYNSVQRIVSEINPFQHPRYNEVGPTKSEDFACYRSRTLFTIPFYEECVCRYTPEPTYSTCSIL